MSHANHHGHASDGADVCTSGPVFVSGAQATVRELVRGILVLYIGCGQRVYATRCHGGAERLGIRRHCLGRGRLRLVIDDVAGGHSVRHSACLYCMDLAMDRGWMDFLALPHCKPLIDGAAVSVWRLSKAFCSREHRLRTCHAERAVRVHHARGMPSGGCTHVQCIAVSLLPMHASLHFVQSEC